MKHHVLVIGLLCALLTLGISAAQAQDSLSEGWPVEQHCVGEPTNPPQDWKWDGRIFVQGIEGIRVLDADYATPYFVLFDSPFIYSASLSPDGKWYAVPTGYQDYSLMSAFVVQGIEIVSTGIDRKMYHIPWVYYAYVVSAVDSLYRVVWLDETHLIYPDQNDKFYSIDPFANTSTKIEDKFSAVNAYISPDSSRAVQGQDRVIDDKHSPFWGVYAMPSGELITSITDTPEFFDNAAIKWLPDSSRFIVSNAMSDSDYRSRLTLWGRDGDSQDVLFTSEENQYLKNMSLSPDGHFLAFSIYQHSHLYIADMEKQHIVDTCLPIDEMFSFVRIAWSPDSTELAFSSNNQVVVLNVETGEFYEIASKIGQVVAWGQK